LREIIQLQVLLSSDFIIGYQDVCTGISSMQLYRKQWHYITSSKKKARTIPSISYITVFLDAKGSILVDFLTINAAH
jgi:hypothetical protein